jgi:ABC-type transport system substrate-binding protein
MIGCVRWSLYTVLLLVFLVAGLAAAQAPKPGGTLRVAWEADVTGLDPYLSPGVQAWHTVGNLFSSLVTVDTNLNSTQAAPCCRPWPSTG